MKNYQLLELAKLLIYLPLMILPILSYMILGQEKKGLITKDIRSAYETKFPGCRYGNFIAFYRLMVDVKEFRNIYYFRIGRMSFMFDKLLSSVKSLIISKIPIGGGVFVEHGTSTYINANSIGENFMAKQNVTVGWHNGRPTIGDNVTIGTGAVVIGNIKIGNDVKIGAGAIVVKDISDGCTVVSPQAIVVKRYGQKII